MKIGERIRNLRLQKERTQKELAYYLSMSTANISDYENDKKQPPLKVLEKICNFFNVQINDLLNNDSCDTEKNNIKVPVYGRIPAGLPMEAIEDVVEIEELPASMGGSDKEYFGLLVSGSSMSPKFLDGDIIICRKCQTCASGSPAVVMVNSSDAVLKNLIIEPDGILLEPINQAFPSMFYSKSEIENLPIRLLGIVVELRRKIL